MAHFQNNADFLFVLHLCVIHFLTEGSVRAKKEEEKKTLKPVLSPEY